MGRGQMRLTLDESGEGGAAEMARIRLSNRSGLLVSAFTALHVSVPLRRILKSPPAFGTHKSFHLIVNG